MTEEVSTSCTAVSLSITPEWWTFVLTGIIAVILGFLAFTWTPAFILSLGYLIGIMVIAWSVISIIQGITTKEGTGARLHLIFMSETAFFLVSKDL